MKYRNYKSYPIYNERVVASCSHILSHSHRIKYLCGFMSCNATLYLPQSLTFHKSR